MTTIKTKPAIRQTSLSDGAMTLVRDCVGGASGERLLIVEEPFGTGFYDDDAPRLTADAARSLGMKVYVTQLDSHLSTETDIQSLQDSLCGFDHVVFFSRVGDQIRFFNNENMPSATMCYTLDRDSLNSAFGTACYSGLCEIKSAIDEAFALAKEIRVTCPLGTDYIGRLPKTDSVTNVDVTLKRFPMLVPQPVVADGFSGRVAISRFLVGTGSQFHDLYYLPLASTVFAHIDGNRITGFEGDPNEVAKVEQHYTQVSGEFDVEPWYVHSWHAGMHPGCEFNNNAEQDISRWCSSVFGNPRLLHFHTCGEYAPGEITWNIVDPDIYLDGVAVWHNGNLYPQRLPNAPDVLDNHPNLAALFQSPYRAIGLSA